MASFSRPSTSRGDYGQAWGQGAARCFCIESDFDEDESVRLLPIPECFICPMSQTPMEDPVMTVDGCVYERSYIEQWMRHRQQHRQPVTSPATNQELPSQRLVSLTALKKAIEAYLAHRPELKGSLTASRSFEEAAQMLQSDLLEKQAAHVSAEDELSLLRDSNEVLTGALQEAERSYAKVYRENEQVAATARILEEAVREREGTCCALRVQLQLLEERCRVMASRLEEIEVPAPQEQPVPVPSSKRHIKANMMRSMPLQFTAVHLCVLTGFLLVAMSLFTVIFVTTESQADLGSVPRTAPWDFGVATAPAYSSISPRPRVRDSRDDVWGHAPELTNQLQDLSEPDAATLGEVELLRHGSGDQRTHAALVLGILATASPANQAAIVQAGAVDLLVDLLNGEAPEARGQAAVALRALAANNTYNKVAIVRAGAIAPLMRLIKEDTLEVQEEAESALLTLAETDSEAATALVDLAAEDADDLAAIARAGALSVFADLLRDQLPGVREEVLAAMRNLAGSDHTEDELAVLHTAAAAGLAMKAAGGAPGRG